MKTFTCALLSFLFLSSISSCKKVSNDGLNGKWKLIETYNGYTNGGTFKWIATSTNSSHTLLFNNNGGFSRKENENGNYKECTGIFIQPSAVRIEITTDCNVEAQKLTITELTSNMLILDEAVIEGLIRYKYKAVK